MANAMVYLPKNAKAGDIVTIKALISHPMETGFRPDSNGRLYPRDIVRRFSAHYDGAEIFRAELHPAIAANPFIAFTTIATKSGPIELSWVGDNGFRHREIVELKLVD